MSLPTTYKVLCGAKKHGEKYFFEEREIPKLQDNQILVKMEYAPLNPSDLWVLNADLKLGPTNPKAENPPLAGFEGSGTVAAVGPNPKVNHKVGDRVHAYGYGAYSEFMLTESDLCSPIKDNLSFEEAASHVINPGTVYYMAKLAEGHQCAIHTAATSALGRILIKYFKKRGIKLINIVRREECIEELKKEGADYVLNSQKPDFEEKLKELAYKENATFALDAISGDFPNKLIRNMPPSSICYVYGCLSENFNASVFVWDLLEYKKISSLVIFDYVEELRKKGELVKFWDEVHTLLPQYFSIKIEKTFKVSQIDEALKYREQHSSGGKILVSPK